jgi:probable rRNA maturation factor
VNHREPAIKVAVANRQARLNIDRRLLSAAVRNVLIEGGIRGGRISIAVVDDPTIHGLNRQFLEHDYPTDVLSFLLEESPRRFEGEIVVSADTAANRAPDYAWLPADELLLYVIHGALHLVGLDDHKPRDRAAMRAKERDHLARLGRGKARART